MAGFLLVERLKQLLPGCDPWETYGNAHAVAEDAVGFLPIESVPDRLPDETVIAEIPRVEGMLALAGALLKFKESQPRAKRIAALLEALVAIGKRE